MRASATLLSLLLAAAAPAALAQNAAEAPATEAPATEAPQAEAPATEAPAAEAPAAAAPAQPAEPEVVRTVHGDWTVICTPDKSRCAMEQLGRTASGESALSMQIEKLPQPQDTPNGKVSAMANILTPLGVLLQEGLKLQVDSSETLGSPFFICHPRGCVVRSPISDGLLNSLKRGAKARLGYDAVIEGQPQSISVEVSLSGFTAAFDALP